MKFKIAAAALAVHVLSHNFESTNFNIANALLHNGVNISNISALDSSSADPSRSSCALAVSLRKP